VATCTPCTPHKARGVFSLAQLLSLVGLGFAFGMLPLQHMPWLPPLLAAPATLLVCALCYTYESRVSPTFAKVSIFLFLSRASQPNLVVLFKWYKETHENCAPLDPIDGLHPLPCFGPEFVGWLDVGGEIAFVIAVSLYSAFLSRWTYRSVFAAIQAGLVLVNLLDLAWVSRLNLAIGLPDELFALGTDIIQPLVDQLDLIPLFALVAKLCPPEATATAFSLNMGLLWLGRSFSGYFGMGLLTALGGVEPPLFTNIRLLVVIRSLTRAIPIALIPLLVPPGSPADDEPGADEPKGGKEGLEAGGSPAPMTPADDGTGAKVQAAAGLAEGGLPKPP